MPRYNRGNRLRPVNRIKHVVDFQGGVVLGATSIRNVILAVDAPTIGSTAEVITGSTVSSIYAKIEVTTTSGTALANAYLACFKNPGGNLTPPSPNAVGGSDNKKYVIHQEMVMLQKFDADIAANPRVLFNGVIRIPKLYQRFGPNDKLDFLILSPGANVDLCMQTHYKEFR